MPYKFSPMHHLQNVNSSWPGVVVGSILIYTIVFFAIPQKDLSVKFPRAKLLLAKVIRQGKLFQRCTHLLYCSVLSLGGNVNTRRMSKLDMDPSFT